jgi:hypothetical protein
MWANRDPLAILLKAIEEAIAGARKRMEPQRAKWRDE